MKAREVTSNLFNEDLRKIEMSKWILTLEITYLRDENGFGRVSHVKYSQKENGSFTRHIFKTDRVRLP